MTKTNKVIAMVIGGGAILAATPASQARPTHCVQQAWNYADASNNHDRSSPGWGADNTAYQDYNDCYGPNACNDYTIPCKNPA